jgi:hypothetical protein
MKKISTQGIDCLECFFMPANDNLCSFKKLKTLVREERNKSINLYYFFTAVPLKNILLYANDDIVGISQ